MENVGLAKYENMVGAIAECHRVDEVKQIRDKAVALQAYAKQVKNDEVERQLRVIRLRAERRAGELLIEMKEAGERDPGGRGRIEFRTGTQLGTWGITKKMSWVWQKLAEIPEETFEFYCKNRDNLSSYWILRQRWAEAFDRREGLSLRGIVGPPEDLRVPGSLTSANPSPLKTLKVHFRKPEDVETFSKLIGQTITMKTRAVWFPPQDWLSWLRENPLVATKETRS